MKETALVFFKFFEVFKQYIHDKSKYDFLKLIVFFILGLVVKVNELKKGGISETNENS